MNIGIVGKGFVGSAVYDGLGQIDNNMLYHDPKYNTDIKNVINTELIFICVPTDMLDNGKCDTSIVEKVLKELNDNLYTGVICIKSTVIPGTTENLQLSFPNLKIACVPEFLRERSALSDFVLEHDVLIIGCQNQNEADIIIKAHGNIPKKISIVSPTEAELCKYFNNVYNALRITFANGFYEVCEKMNCNYQNIFNAITQRKNIDSNYLRASKNMRGFGGYCLPKDSSAFAELVKELFKDERPELFDKIVSDNKLYITTVFDGMRK